VIFRGPKNQSDQVIMSEQSSGAVVAGTLEVLVNDRARSVPAGATVLSLLAELGLVERKGVAVAVNGGVVGRTQWPARPLQAGDRVLIIQATQGG
jgi:sulfur carrier protein